MEKFKLLLLTIIVLFLTGCSDYRELTDMSIVSSIGIDIKDGKYVTISQILSSNESNSQDESNTSNSKVVVYKSTGKTIHEALRNTILESPKKLYVGHLETVIISEKVAKNNITKIFDFFLRDAEVRKDFKLLIASDDEFYEIMDTLTPLETIPGKSITLSVNIASKLQGKIADVTFDKFVSNVIQTGVDAVIPIIKISETKTENEEINPKKRLTIDNKLGIFNNDKLFTYISEDASLGYSILYGDNIENIISFKCKDDIYSSIELIKNNSKLFFDINSNTVNIDVNIKASISELNCNINISNEKGIKILENQAEKEIYEIMNNTIIEAVKNYKSDFLGIGKNIYQNNYKYYKKNNDNIENIIKNMKSNISVNVDIIQKGIIKEGDEK